MARTKKAPQTIEHDNIDDNHQLTATANEMAAHSAEIVKAYGHGVPYNRDHYLDKARGHIMRSAEEALELGRCLIVMKEHEPHGEWINILETLSLERTIAARTMHAAVKFSNVATSQHLVEAAKSKSKVFELMILDDAQLEQLNEGQTVAGINLDSIEKMSVIDLRKALRDAKAELKAKDDVASENASRIKELQEKTALIKNLPADQLAVQMRGEITSLVTGIDHEMRVNFYDAINTLRDSTEGDHGEFIRTQLQALAETVEFLQVELGGDLPEWMN